MTRGSAPAVDQAWPEGGLEPVPACPACGSERRHLLHDRLTDRVFRVAPGHWSLWQCDDCRTAWLDPRPNAATIALAYRDYYTHGEAPLPPPTTVFQRLRAALGNGYRNRRFGTRLEPSLRLGAVLGLLPPLRQPVDVTYRFLPSPTGRRRRLLDIGCGNGAFLELAKSAGWEVAGVEPDPVSRALTAERGIEVRETAEDWLGDKASFDYVTVSHVIEHVHDPAGLLRDIHALLRPGGGVYVDTPNIDAVGHRIYGRDWLPLDPPRHLILFNRASLKFVVSRAGFEDVRVHRRPDVFDFSSEQSRRLAIGLDPFGDEHDPAMPPRPGSLMRLRARLAGARAEFLTLTAEKPR